MMPNEKEPCLIPEELRALAADENIQTLLPVSGETLYYLIAKRFHAQNHSNINRFMAELDDAWDEAEYRDRLFRLIENLPSLRSDFIQDRSRRCWQVIYRRKDAPVLYRDLTGLTEEGQRRCISDFWQILDGEDALFACALLILSAKKSVLLVRVDHAVADGVSFSVILNELTAGNYRALSCDTYVEHRRSAILAAAQEAPAPVLRYYRDMPAVFSAPDRPDMRKASCLQESVLLSAEDTQELVRRSREEGATPYTLAFLSHARALMRFYGKEEIWIRYLSHGRRRGDADEMRLVGNLIVEKPVHVRMDTTAKQLRSDMLMLDSFPGMSDTTLFRKADPNGMPQGIISKDYWRPGPLIRRIVPIENERIYGNSLYMEEGRLRFRFSRPARNIPMNGQESLARLFSRELFPEG